MPSFAHRIAVAALASASCLACSSGSPGPTLVSDPWQGLACTKVGLVSQLPPGTPITNVSTTGFGACAATSLGAAITTVQAAHPELADITQVGAGFTDGSYITAYATAEGGFALVFKRGGGDCPAGCTENEYWYFTTDGAASCTENQVGHYRYAYDDVGNCIDVEGTAMWGSPAPGLTHESPGVCGADTTALDVSGTYDFCVAGTSSTDCATSKGAVNTQVRELHLTIAQTPGDLAHGTVTFSATGTTLDGIALDAKIARQVVTVEVDGQTPGDPIAAKVSLTIDLAGNSAGGLQFFEATSGAAPSDSCKTSLLAGWASP